MQHRYLVRRAVAAEPDHRQFRATVRTELVLRQVDDVGLAGVWRPPKVGQLDRLEDLHGLEVQRICETARCGFVDLVGDITALDPVDRVEGDARQLSEVLTGKAKAFANCEQLVGQANHQLSVLMEGANINLMLQRVIIALMLKKVNTAGSFTIKLTTVLGLTFVDH